MYGRIIDISNNKERDYESSCAEKKERRLGSMRDFKAYTHVVRVDDAKAQGLLDNDIVYITAKVDGTNSSVWADADGTLHAGARTREITSAPEKDNLGFAKWVLESNDDEAVALRGFAVSHPEYVVFGEWMGEKRLAGAIKRYDREKYLRRFMVFDVWDIEAEEYLADDVWRPMLEADPRIAPYVVELLATLSYPTIDDVLEVAKTNRFMLPEGDDQPGEGVVCKSPGWKNYQGKTTYGKLVLKGIQKKKSGEAFDDRYPFGVEVEIVDYYLTEAELEKALAKTLARFGLDKFDANNKGCWGFYMNECFTGAILDECADFVKRFKSPVVDFEKLRKIAGDVAREYIEKNVFE